MAPQSHGAIEGIDIIAAHSVLEAVDRTLQGAPTAQAPRDDA
jgi:hypothetical protein